MNIFKAIGNAFMNGLHFIGYCFLYLYGLFFIPCKAKGKKNIRKNDEVRVFISNHMQVYGPLSIHIHFPLRKKAFWINENMLDKDKIEQQCAITLLDKNEYKGMPMWLRKYALHLVRNLGHYTFTKRVKSLSISRDNPRELINTFSESMKMTEKGYNLVIFPEINYQEQGMGEIYTAFTGFAKYIFKHTKKIVSFYPVYISRVHKCMNIGKPIDYNPEDENYKDNISNYLVNEINEYSKRDLLSKKEVKKMTV